MVKSTRDLSTMDGSMALVLFGIIMEKSSIKVFGKWEISFKPLSEHDLSIMIYFLLQHYSIG
jgi:hypothetical protein